MSDGEEGRDDAPLVYLIAGEPSGDLLGGRLMAALRAETGGRVRFAGVGGEAMRAQGLDSLFPMADLTVMGLVEVLPRLPRILGRIKETLADIEARAPVAVVTIDSWGFCGRVQAGLKARGHPAARIHYVAPMVWAWKAGRTRTLARCLDLLLTLLPNEPVWFQREGLAAVHVGHPVVEGASEGGDAPAAAGQALRARLGVPEGAPVLCVLPGSRASETSRLLPVFAETLAALASAYPGLVALVPTVETVGERVAAAVRDWPVPTIVLRGADDRRAAFACADAALAASGTVALELALAGLPAVIAYRVSPLSAFVATRFLGLKIRFACLVNILVDDVVMPEFLQDRCRSDLLSPAVDSLLRDAAARQRQRQGAARALAALGMGGEAPSRRAARAILDHLETRR